MKHIGVLTMMVASLAVGQEVEETNPLGIVTYELEGGRKVTIETVSAQEMPAPEKKPEVQSAPILPWDSPEFSAMRERMAKTINLSISATVVDERATLLRWWHEGTEYRAWSNTNWMYLSGFGSYEANGKTFFTILSPGRMKSKNLPNDSLFQIPPDLPSQSGTYRLIQGDPANAEAFEGIEEIHKVYRSDFNRLKEAYEQREKKQMERQAELLANPPVPEDITIRGRMLTDEEVSRLK